MNDRFTFFASFREAAKGMPDDMRLRFYDAITEYGIEGTEPELDGMLTAVFALVKPVIDSGAARRENGKKGGRPVKAKANEGINETIGFENENHRLSKAKPDKDQEKDKEVDKDMEQEVDYWGDARARLSPKLLAAFTDWMEYITARGTHPEEISIGKLIVEIEASAKTFGEDKVVSVVSQSIANGYKGIAWAMLKKTTEGKTGQFYQFQQGEYDYKEIERKLREN